MNKKIFSVFGSILIFILGANFVFAAPDIQINSPQNMTYDATQILVNITFNETVDVFVKNPRGKNSVVAQNITSIESFVYVRDGSYDYEIWANSTSGTSNATVSFTNTMHNPVNITDCGTLFSSDTQYVVVNDLEASSRQCIRATNLRNISLDLGGHTITAQRGFFNRALTMFAISDTEVFNGTLNTTFAEDTTSDQTMYAMEIDLSKTRFSNLTLHGFFGFSVFSLEDVIFDNLTINASIGMWHIGLSNVHFINSRFVWNGITSVRSDCKSAAFCDWSDHSEVFLENTTITGFPDQDLHFRGSFSDVFLRNSDIDTNKINYPDFTADVRIFDQHLILINVTDQLNETGSGIVEILDDGTFQRKKGIALDLEPLTNPTGNLLIATDEKGTADVWVTEKLIHARSSSPPVITEYDFSVYNLTARSWDSQASAELNLTGVNSIIPFSMNIVVPRALPECTISQMLDLNNDADVNIQDAVIILRDIAGLPVSSAGAKNCTGIDLNPF